VGEVDVAEERGTIGLSGSLSGLQRMSIVFPGACLALFAIASFGAALANLGGHLARAGVAGLVGLAFSALLARFLYDFIPQRAWLEGSVLAVERGGRERRCDLASAEIIKLSLTMPPLTRGYSDAVPVLRARQEPRRRHVRVVLRGDDLRIVPASQLVLLAEAIESGPAPAPRAPKVCRRLRDRARRQQPLPELDWSFRTDPHDTRSAIDNNQH
jgi:hypothetical protein